MLFTDSIFLFYFLPIALLLHRAALALSGQKTYGNAVRILIFGLTVLFYGIKEPWWLLPFFTCIGFDFFWATLLTRTTSDRKRKVICSLSIIQNLTLLGVFKYLPFLYRNVVKLVPEARHYFPQLLENGHSLPLPPGISFYTFESLSFVIDVYRRNVIPPKNPLEFFAFIGMFPRFIAGPIVRYREMVDQFKNYGGMKVESGLFLFAFGLFLKSCFADSFEVFTSYAFGRAGGVEFLSAWIGSISYSFQIYFDFSGYSLMAIGIGRCLGFVFPQNFNKPYHAASVQDFWRRWHMTLSTWLRDYLYIPLGGSKKGARRTSINLFLTMLLGGLWHGSDWGFVVWGAWHGSSLLVERALTEKRAKAGKPAFNPLFHRLITLLVVQLGWVIFRAPKLPEGFKILRAMFSPFSNPLAFNVEGFLANPMHLVLALAGILYCIFVERGLDLRALETMNAPTNPQRALAILMFVVSVMILLSAPTVPFIYFQF